MQVRLSRCGAQIDKVDVAHLECLIQSSLPQPFLEFYNRHNGGIPEPDYLPAKGQWDAMEVNSFLPIAVRGGDETTRTVNNVYLGAISKGLFPKFLVPFAQDSGANYYCLDARSGAVVFWANDMYDPAASLEENQSRATRPVYSSFQDFASAFISEDEACC